MSDTGGRLSIQEIRAILDLCRRKGVLRLSCQGLSVELCQWDDKQHLHPRPRLEAKAAQKDLVDQERSARREELDHMMIEQPLAYEELVASGELERNAEEPDRGRSQ
jgi:hypothetical protein